MKDLSGTRRFIVALVALAFLGCMSGGHRATMAVQSGTEKGENQHCSWTVDKADDGKVLAGSLQISNKSGEGCTAYHSGNKLYIGDTPNKGSEVIYIGSVRFRTKGSPCRYCYMNTFGGMTCITYPGPC